MIPWAQLTAALDELDVIRAQVRESRGQERAARFYALLDARRPGAEPVAAVIELAGGWVVAHWLHDSGSIALYTSIVSARQILCQGGAFILALEDSTQERVVTAELRVHRGADLTPRQRDLLVALSHGLSNAQIGARLGIRERTVKNALTRIYGKLGVGDRTQAALLARDLSMTDTPDPEPLMPTEPAPHVPQATMTSVNQRDDLKDPSASWKVWTQREPREPPP